jgi:hypothetical protein
MHHVSLVVVRCRRRRLTHPRLTNSTT